MKVIAIIPARYQSTRLPGKLLAEIDGQSVLQRVYNQAVKTEIFHKIIVATDHKKVVDHCESRGMDVKLTSDTHISGTDRIAEVAAKEDADIFINIQGDEPFIETHCIIALVTLLKDEQVKIGTLYKKLAYQNDLFDYNVVKLVKDKRDKVIYFSRQAIPAVRDKPYKEWYQETGYFQHLGLYGFKKETLLEIVKLEPTILEKAEKLEQLRWIENGYSIYGREVESDSFGIDTEEDLIKANSLYK